MGRKGRRAWSNVGDTLRSEQYGCAEHTCPKTRWEKTIIMEGEEDTMSHFTPMKIRLLMQSHLVSALENPSYTPQVGRVNIRG